MYIHSRCIWYWTDTFVMLMLLKRGDMNTSNQPNKFLFCSNALKKSLMTAKKKNSERACFTVIVLIRGTQSIRLGIGYPEHLCV